MAKGNFFFFLSSSSSSLLLLQLLNYGFNNKQQNTINNFIRGVMLWLLSTLKIFFIFYPFDKPSSSTVVVLGRHICTASCTRKTFKRIFNGSFDFDGRREINNNNNNQITTESEKNLFFFRIKPFSLPPPFGTWTFPTNDNLFASNLLNNSEIRN